MIAGIVALLLFWGRMEHRFTALEVVHTEREKRIDALEARLDRVESRI